MLIQSMQTNVKTANVGAISTFNMDANAKAFRVLSDTLYQNKIGSMVREVSCNAYDSHIMAGKPDVPFTIHMPDSFAPHFSVKDSGIGLDDDGVREVFASYFRSTKDADNTMVGSFGLGSKTPFAYTDAFFIIAVKDGVKRNYSAVIGSDGTPSVVLMGEIATTEPNGVEVSVPVVNSDDFAIFRHEVATQLKFFDVKPVVTNCAAIDWVDIEGNTIIKSGNLEILNSSTNALKGVWVVQGVVGYPLDYSAVSQHLSTENRGFLDSLKRNTAIIRFPLGDIEVTPSREGVSYSKYTLANMGKALDIARANMTSVIIAKLDTMNDCWERAIFVHGDRNFATYFKGTNYKLDNPLYRNDGSEVTIPLTALVSVLDASVGDTYIQRYENNARRQSSTPKWSPAYNYNNVTSILRPNTETRIIIVDTDDKVARRRRLAMAELTSASLPYVVTGKDGAAAPEGTREALIDLLGASVASHIVCLSEIELPVTVKGPRAVRENYKLPTMYTYHRNADSIHKTLDWTREYTSLADVPAAYYTIVHNGQVNDVHDATLPFEMARMGLLDRPVVAIRERDVKKIADNPEWITIGDFVTNLKAKVLANKTFINGMAAFEAKGLIECEGYYNRMVGEGIVLDRHSPFAWTARANRIIDKLTARLAKHGFLNVYANIIRASGLHLPIAEPVGAKSTAMNAIVNKQYPLLEYCHRYTNIADIAQYVKLIDDSLTVQS
jgi:hypothetical protein